MLRADELERQAAVVSGLAAVANLHRDRNLIGWAKSQGLTVGIMRSGMWRGQFGNPFVIEPGVDRAEVCRRFAEWLPRRQELMAAVPGLRGRLLVCCCHPLQCHGHELARLANSAGVAVLSAEAIENVRQLRGCAELVQPEDSVRHKTTKPVDGESTGSESFGTGSAAMKGQ